MILVNFYEFMADFGEWLLSWPHPKLFTRKPFREWGKVKPKKFIINDLVKLNGNPFDEQIPEELLLYAFLKDKEQRITMTMVPDEEGTSGLWIRTDMIPDWTDAAWFDKI